MSGTDAHHPPSTIHYPPLTSLSPTAPSGRCVSRSSVATVSARVGLIDLAEGSSEEGLNPGCSVTDLGARQRPDYRLPPPRQDQARPCRDHRFPRLRRATSALTSPNQDEHTLFPFPYRGLVADATSRRTTFISDPGDRQAADPHLRRNARVVRQGPGRRAALHRAGRPPGRRPVQGQPPGDPFTSTSRSESSPSRRSRRSRATAGSRSTTTRSAACKSHRTRALGNERPSLILLK